MNSKEALKKLLLMINREKHINSEWNKKICNLEQIIKIDLEILEIQRLVQKQALENIVKEGMEEMKLPKAVNTYEALDYLKRMSNKYQMIRYPGVGNLTIDGYYEQVKQDLDQLEKLEKENQELKEKVKMLKELNNINKKFADLATKAIQENNKLKKVIEILKDKLEITLYSHDEYFNPPMINGTEIFKNLTQEEYDLLKEVLGDDK